LENGEKSKTEWKREKEGGRRRKEEEVNIPQYKPRNLEVITVELMAK